MSGEKVIIEMIKDMATALTFMGQAITKDDKNQTERYKLIQLANAHLDRLIEKAKFILDSTP